MAKKRVQDGLLPVGQLLLDTPALKPPSKVQARLIDTAVEIRDGAPEEIAFQHSVLCQTSLPYRSTPERRWEAQNGNVVLLVQAGEAFHPGKRQWIELPLPFGPKARLILIYLNSEAIRTQSPVIDVEDSMTAFLRHLQNGRDPNGDEIQKFKQQLAALAQAKISMAAIDPTLDRTAHHVSHGNPQIVKFLDLWFPKNPNQRILWPGTLELTQDYFQDLVNHAVPLDQRAIAALSHSAMALDAYAWLAQRLHRIPAGKGQLVTWVNLYQQFGHGYKLLRQFRSAFLKTLKDVYTQYPEAKVEVTDNGLTLKQSAPPITKRGLIRGA